jgi:CubicO group peptidase (beta-lactamase class C family)
MRRAAVVLLLLALGGCARSTTSAPPPDRPPTPKTIDEFRAAVQRVLDETRVPGAGIALVRQSGIEWAGGLGFADRDRRTPVTADTHFRVGSISKTFVAMGLVQLSEDGMLDLDDPVSILAPHADIDNPWEETDPVRLIHVLQHTAGFDDMHFNETYNVVDPPDMPLEDVLDKNPRSRRVRWRPGTRMAYSNPGYAVAGYILEQVSGKTLDEFIRERIFNPVGMSTSSFVLTQADNARLAKGYDRPTGPPVPFTQIYLRPAGNLHTSAAELGAFVRMLLNWGEAANGDLVIDPEYLSNMEHPRTTLGSRAGLREGYGSGIYATPDEPFALLGHNGGIDGFVSTYAYSPARDVGYVVLLNATYASEALRRIALLAIRYLKADVEPPAKPQAAVSADVLRQYEGYYHDANPRNQAMAFVAWMRSGRTIVAEGGALVARPVLGPSVRLIPVSDSLFRLEREVDATRVFTKDERGEWVMAGANTYAERVPRWRVEIVRVPVGLSLPILATPFVAAIPWLVHARRARPRGFWGLKVGLVLCPTALAVPVFAFLQAGPRELGLPNAWTQAIYTGTLSFPVTALLALVLTVAAWLGRAGRWLRAYAAAVSLAALIVSGYLLFWGVVGFKTWDY